MPRYVNKLTGRPVIFPATPAAGINHDISGKRWHLTDVNGGWLDMISGAVIYPAPAFSSPSFSITFSAGSGLDPVLTGGTGIVWTGPSGQESTGTTPSPALNEAGTWVVTADDLSAITGIDCQADTVTAITGFENLTGLTTLAANDNAGLGVDALVAELYGLYGTRPNLTADISGTCPDVSGTSAGYINEMVNDTWTFNTDAFLFTVKSDNTGTSNNDQFTIPLDGVSSYNFTVYYDGVSTNHNTSANLTITFPSGAGTYGVMIMGTFPRIRFNNTGDKQKLTLITQFGNVSWGTSWESAFFGCYQCTDFGSSSAFPTNAADLLQAFRDCVAATAFPDLSACSGLTNLQRTWYGCSGCITGFSALPTTANSLTTMYQCWYNCSNGTTFPNLPTTANALTTIYQSWYGCSSATTLGTLPTTAGMLNNVSGAWYGCSGATTFPAVDHLTSINNLQDTWRNCSTATTFPAVNSLTSVTTLLAAWYGCSSGTSFPTVSALTSVNTLRYTWYACSGATTFPAVNTLTGVTGTGLQYTWYNCSSGTSFPAVSSLTSITSLQSTWFGCAGATTFPAVNTLTGVTDLNSTYQGCTSMTTAPDTDSLTSVTNYYFTYSGCTSMTTAPVFPTASTALTDVRSVCNGIGAGMGGTVEDLWNATDFPNIVNYANAFTGDTGLTNYASIPNDWKGL